MDATLDERKQYIEGAYAMKQAVIDLLHAAKRPDLALKVAYLPLRPPHTVPSESDGVQHGEVNTDVQSKDI
jgi:hypothetical protein